MKTTLSVLAGAAAAVALAVSSAVALPLGPSTSTGAAPEADDLVTKVQSMCNDGYGRWVPCWQLRRRAPPPPTYQGGYGRGYGGGGGYGRGDYRRDNEARCAVIYNNCIMSYPRGTAPYYRCMQSQRC